MRCLAIGLMITSVASFGMVYAQEGPGTTAPDSTGPVVRHARAAKRLAVRVFGPPPPSSAVPAYEASFGFNYVHANAGPSGCGCFHMYGENAQFGVAPRGGIEAVADFGRTTANNISGEGHDITLTTYLVGVRYPFKPYRRLASYSEILIGLGHTDTNFVIDGNATGFAYAFGGGVNYPLQHHFELKVVEVDFLGTLIPNGVNDRQNQFRVTSGVVYHFQRSHPALLNTANPQPSSAAP